jgi:hypothetical protein
MVKMTKQDLQWQAESDASTMARYQEIISDKARMNRAIKEANKQASDLNKRANAMKSAANIKATGGKVSRRK